MFKFKYLQQKITFAAPISMKFGFVTCGGTHATFNSDNQFTRKGSLGQKL